MTSHSNYLLDYLHGLWKDQRLTDVIIQCGNSQFRAHSLLLSAYSRYFRTILSAKVVYPSGHFYLDVTHTGISAQTFHNVLEFLYTGNPLRSLADYDTMSKAVDILSITILPSTGGITTAVKQEHLLDDPPDFLRTSSPSDMDVVSDTMATDSDSVRFKTGGDNKKEFTNTEFDLTCDDEKVYEQNVISDIIDDDDPIHDVTGDDYDDVTGTLDIYEGLQPVAMETKKSSLHKVKRLTSRRMGPLSKTSGVGQFRTDNIKIPASYDDVRELRVTLHDVFTSDVTKASINSKRLKRKSQKGREVLSPKMCYKCGECGLVVSGKRAYNQHLTQEHKAARSSKNSKNIKRMKHLKDHLEKNHQGQEAEFVENRGFPCTKCTEVFKSKLLLQKHDIKVHNSTSEGAPSKPTFQCKTCDANFDNKDQLLHHIEMHRGHGEVICHECGKTFKGKLSLNTHVRYAHSERKVFVCEICNKPLSKQYTLRLHMIRCHNMYQSEKIQCDQCAKSFLCESELKRHQNSAHSNHKYVCHICGKSYNYDFTLITHIQSEHPDGVSEFRCYGCGKLCNTKFSLSAHTTKCEARKAKYKEKEEALIQKAHVVVKGVKDKVVINKEKTGSDAQEGISSTTPEHD